MLTAIALSAALAQSPEQVIEDIQRSHIEGHVPAAADFARLLSRDLTKHLTTLRGKALRTEHELLRDGPTQSGVAYPKFYVWVRVFQDKSLVEEGAARVAAVERKAFEVTNYVEAKAIRADPDKLNQVFPLPVAEKIKARLGIK